METEDSDFLSGLNSRKTLKFMKKKPMMKVENNVSGNKILEWQKWLRHTPSDRVARTNESIIETEEQKQVRELNDF